VRTSAKVLGMYEGLTLLMVLCQIDQTIAVMYLHIPCVGSQVKTAICNISCQLNCKYLK